MQKFGRFIVGYGVCMLAVRVVSTFGLHCSQNSAQPLLCGHGVSLIGVSLMPKKSFFFQMCGKDWSSVFGDPAGIA
jgi:hypothetical protein